MAQTKTKPAATTTTTEQPTPDWRDVINGRADDQADDTVTEAAVETIGDAAPKSRADFTEIEVGTGPCKIGDRVTYRGNRKGLVVDFTENPDAQGWKADPWLVKIEFDGGTLVDALPREVDVTSSPESSAVNREDLYDVPTNLSFGGKETKIADDLRRIGQDLIATCEELKHLQGKTLDYLWVAEGGSSSGEATLAKTRNLSKFERGVYKGEKMVVLSADHLRGMLADKDTVTALVHQQLCAIGKSKKGKLFIKAPDFLGYTANVGRFGAQLPMIRVAAQALARDVQDIRNGRLPFEDAAEEDEIDDDAEGDAGV